MSTDDLERRIRVLEGILGVDPAVGCRGLGEECPECDPDQCPLKRNTLRRMARLLNQTMDDLLLVRCWAQELEFARVLPPGTWERAQTRRELLRVDSRLQQVRNLVGHLGKVEGSPFGEQLHRQIRELQEERATLTRTLAEVEV